MSENEMVLEMKREALKKELNLPEYRQNKFKIKRLEESIKRHKEIARGIKERYERYKRH